MWSDDLMIETSSSLRRGGYCGLAGVLLLAAGCSTTEPDAAAVELIEGDLSEQIGLGALTGECDEPSTTSTGDEFACNGTTETGEVINFTAKFFDLLNL